MPVAQVTLEDKYTRESGLIFLTGIQALARLAIVQNLRDRRAGHHTAGFISGYRGSPLAGLDQQLERAKQHLEAHNVLFQPGINEDLAATAVWGSQMTGAFPGASYDGVYAMWYGKAPGVDRSGDAIKHANASGTAALGGVLAIAGDDHNCKSSTLPSQSEYSFMDAGIPVLNPAGIQEVLDYGIYGWALSRYSGCWTAMIALADTMDSSATVYADINRVQIRLPEDFELPPVGVNFRVGVSPHEQEEILHRHKLYAALAFARANELNQVVMDAPKASFGIVTTGKAYLAVRQALTDLGIGEHEAADIGIRLYKVGMPWPLDKAGITSFGEDLDEILVVEEKRAVMENQIKEQLYNAPFDKRPRVVGKFDEHREWLLPSMGDLTPGKIARVIAQRLAGKYNSERIDVRMRELDEGELAMASADGLKARTPFYCAGCPHNLSTVVPEGSRGMAGIGCHYMVRWMGRNSDTFSQMGGEGVHWIGQAPFTEEEHVFANLGDGTYHHSGILAIRAAVASGVNITYKILFNGAVAMTGGQSVDGPLTVSQLTQQLAAEGVTAIAVVAEDPKKYEDAPPLAPMAQIHPREELDRVQKRLRGTPGCTALVYDQTCAAELRRRRKRGVAVDPPKRVFINDAVCEGCGDCSVQSNCVAIEPLETELGRKRTINQSSCNKDFSCLKGLCPSFVSVHGGSVRKAGGDAALPADAIAALPTPELPSLDEPWNVLITGVGGTGVVTVGALLGMAAHLEGKGSTCLDMTGLAQKGGAVISHVRIASRPEDIHTPRIAARSADALLACDLIVAASADAVLRLGSGRTGSVVNTHVAPTAEFVRDNDIDYEAGRFLGVIHDQSREMNSLDSTRLASALLGDSVTGNILMLGYAFQRGLVPLSLEALERAIELNGVAVAANQQAFSWGRLAAEDAAAVTAKLPEQQLPRRPLNLGELIEHREALLARYQGRSAVRRFRALMEEISVAEASRTPGREELKTAVAEGFSKLIAYKDEYEIARLYTSGDFMAKLGEQFEGDFKIELQLAPPLWARVDPETGRPEKRSYGAWMLTAMRVLARFKFLRGTALDIFGNTEERKLERRLIDDYERIVRRLASLLSPENHEVAVEIASLPQQIRGFGVVKIESARKAEARARELLEGLDKPEPLLVVDTHQGDTPSS